MATVRDLCGEIEFEERDLILITRGVCRISSTKDWKIGQTVARLGDELIYTLEEIQGETAVVCIEKDQSPTGEKITKKFPARELYDPNTVRNILEFESRLTPAMRASSRDLRESIEISCMPSTS